MIRFFKALPAILLGLMLLLIASSVDVYADHGSTVTSFQPAKFSHSAGETVRGNFTTTCHVGSESENVEYRLFLSHAGRPGHSSHIVAQVNRTFLCGDESPKFIDIPTTTDFHVGLLGSSYRLILDCSACNPPFGQERLITILDGTPPEITFDVVVGTLGSNGWYRSSVQFFWVFNDPDSGIDGFSRVGCDPAFLNFETSGFTTSCTITNLDGLTSFETRTIKIDLTRPVITGSLSPSSNGNGWNNTDVTVNFACVDSGPVQSGIALNTASGSTLSTEGTGQSVSNSGSCSDDAGNSALQSTVNGINIDKTNPSITGGRSPLANSNGWNNTDISVSFSCTDSLSGVEVGFPTGDTTLSSDGASQSVLGTCNDQAGNSVSNTVSGINIDKTDPSITSSRSPLANINGWNNTDVSVSFFCSDALSGLEAGSPTGDATLTSEGAGQSVTGTCVDRAGNSAQDSVSDINIDRTDPVIQESVTPQSSIHGWHNTDVNISVTCVDLGSVSSGIDQDTASGITTLTSEGAGQSVATSGTCTDRAGNSVVANGQFVINIDKTVPVIAGSQSPPPNALGWNNTDVEVSFICADIGSVQSGIAEDTIFGGALTKELADQFVTNGGVCIDKADNIASNVTFPGVNIDKTPPAITIFSPAIDASFLMHEQVRSNWIAQDSLSGIDTDSISATLDTGEMISTAILGADSFFVSAADRAGNLTEVTNSYLITLRVAGGVVSGGTFVRENSILDQPITGEAPMVGSLPLAGEYTVAESVELSFQLRDANGNAITDLSLSLSISKVTIDENGEESHDVIPESFQITFNETNQTYEGSVDTTTLEAGIYDLFVSLPSGLLTRVRIQLNPVE